MKTQKIRTKPDDISDKLEISGWLDGGRTYLWFGDGYYCIGTLSGQKLYRLAKAIVKNFDSDK